MPTTIPTKPEARRVWRGRAALVVILAFYAACATAIATEASASAGSAVASIAAP